MFTRFDTTNGKLVVSAMKPAPITKARVAAGENRNASSMEITIGVRINAAPSLANNADTSAPSNTMNAKSLRPLPLHQRATCNAAQAKNPASSSSKLMMISATKVPVAFQIIYQTSGMSLRCTTPKSSARIAPNTALQPTPRPLGCQITRVMVSRKINDAMSMHSNLEQTIGMGICNRVNGQGDNSVEGYKNPRHTSIPCRSEAC